MKSHFLKIQFILLVSLLMCACTDDNEEGKKVTDYSEYTLTVASVKLPGVLTSSGNNNLLTYMLLKKITPTSGKLMVILPSLNTKKDMNT